MSGNYYEEEFNFSRREQLQKTVYIILVKGIPLCLKYINKINYTSTQSDTTI